MAVSPSTSGNNYVMPHFNLANNYEDTEIFPVAVELSKYIFSFLTKKEVANAALVSRSWRAFINKGLGKRDNDLLNSFLLSMEKVDQSKYRILERSFLVIIKATAPQNFQLSLDIAKKKIMSVMMFSEAIDVLVSNASNSKEALRALIDLMIEKKVFFTHTNTEEDDDPLYSSAGEPFRNELSQKLEVHLKNLGEQLFDQFSSFDEALNYTQSISTLDYNTSLFFKFYLVKCFPHEAKNEKEKMGTILDFSNVVKIDKILPNNNLSFKQIYGFVSISKFISISENMFIPPTIIREIGALLLSKLSSREDAINLMNYVPSIYKTFYHSYFYDNSDTICKNLYFYDLLQYLESCPLNLLDYVFTYTVEKKVKTVDEFKFLTESFYKKSNSLKSFTKNVFDSLPKDFCSEELYVFLKSLVSKESKDFSKYQHKMFPVYLKIARESKSFEILNELKKVTETEPNVSILKFEELYLFSKKSVHSMNANQILEKLAVMESPSPKEIVELLAKFGAFLDIAPMWTDKTNGSEKVTTFDVQALTQASNFDDGEQLHEIRRTIIAVFEKYPEIGISLLSKCNLKIDHLPDIFLEFAEIQKNRGADFSPFLDEALVIAHNLYESGSFELLSIYEECVKIQFGIEN